jgi:hypothetical protein
MASRKREMMGELAAYIVLSFAAINGAKQLPSIQDANPYRRIDPETEERKKAEKTKRFFDQAFKWLGVKNGDKT